MAWRRRAALLACTVVAAAALGSEPPQARANVVCDAAAEATDAVTGAIGIGSPARDACNKVTDPALDAAGHTLDPLKDAAGSIGRGVFAQIGEWTSEGAVWLLGEVVALSEKTTSPDLLDKGFLRAYGRMAQIAVVLALLMAIFAVIESLGRGDGSMLIRVFFVNVPLAAIATSAAYVVVQLLIATTDGFSEAISRSVGADTREFFSGAITALGGAGAKGGAALGAVSGGTGADAAKGAAVGGAAVPLFVGFIAASLAAFAAFFVWIELLMRDAAIYAVSLFMPLALAASIWPRWSGALKRTAELIVVVVFSKFVIVAIISLAASLLAHGEGGIEHLLAAAALLLLACFAPFVLFKLVPFAEGAVASAYNRQSAAGASVHGAHTASSVHMMRRSAFANWSGGGGGEGEPPGGGAGKQRGGGKSGSAAKGGKSGGGGEAATGGAAAGTAAVVGGTAASSAKVAHSGADRLAETGTAQAGSGAASSESTSPGTSAPRPKAAGAEGGEQKALPIAETPEPSKAEGGGAAGTGAKPPRPAADTPEPKDKP